MEEKLRNLTFIVILGFIILGILIIGLYFRDGSSSNNDSSNSTNTGSGSSSSSTENYDVSKMNEVDAEEAVALLDKKGTHVLYIGRSTCSACVQFVPVLNAVQEELGFTTNYLNVQSYQGNWSKIQTDLKELLDKATQELTVNGNEGTFGELFSQYGYTPGFIVIKDGEVVEAFLGSRSESTLKSILEEYFE